MNESTATASKHIMVIEDAGSVADLIREMLSGTVYCVEICMTVEDALAKFAPKKYDLIITDYTMPRMNGIELAHVLRRQAPEQCILLITGSTFSMLEDGREYPVNAFLQKPFSMAEFQDSMTALLKDSAPSVTEPEAQIPPRDSKTKNSRRGGI